MIAVRVAATVVTPDNMLAFEQSVNAVTREQIDSWPDDASHGEATTGD